MPNLVTLHYYPQFISIQNQPILTFLSFGLTSPNVFCYSHISVSSFYSISLPLIYSDFAGLFFTSLCYSFLHISLLFFSSYLFAILFFISLYRSFLRTFLILSSLCLFSQKDLFLHTLHLVIELAPAARLISIGLFDTAAYFYSLNVVGLTVSFLPHQPTRDKQAAATD